MNKNSSRYHENVIIYIKKYKKHFRYALNWNEVWNIIFYLFKNELI